MQRGGNMIRKFVYIALVASVAGSGHVAAQKTDILLSNRFYGVFSAGLGVYFLVEANNSRSDGNEAYDLYQASGNATLAREFFDQSREKDTKSAILLGLGVGTISYGIHLLMKGGSDKLPDPKMDRGLVEIKGVKLDAGHDPGKGRTGLQLRRTF
jgi:hypothetical protein